MKQKKPPTYFRYLAPSCAHGNPVPERCSQCQYEAMRHLEAVKAARARASERQRAEAERPASWESEWPPEYIAYMRRKYPEATWKQWARLQCDDPEAKRLAKGLAR